MRGFLIVTRVPIYRFNTLIKLLWNPENIVENFSQLRQYLSGILLCPTLFSFINQIFGISKTLKFVCRKSDVPFATIDNTF